jgi:U3 small nucleolar RNA-associated protein 3
MCKQLKYADENLNSQIDCIIESLKTSRKIVQVDQVLTTKKQRRRHLVESELMSRTRNRVHFDDESDNEEESFTMANDTTVTDEDASANKRAINYKIEKNKGLTPHRNKLVRNPRVKHREKYRKALIKRKSVVPKVRHETKRYSGEASGIRVGVVRSVKLK